MIALTEAIRDNWHAVERDLLDLGYHADDIGSRLTLCELISVVVAAQSGTAVHYAMTGGWSKEAELLANLGEQQAGIFGLNARYPRPGVNSSNAKPMSEFDRLAPYKGIALEAADSPSEFMSKLRERQQKWRDKMGEK